MTRVVELCYKRKKNIRLFQLTSNFNTHFFILYDEAEFLNQTIIGIESCLNNKQLNLLKTKNKLFQSVYLLLFKHYNNCIMFKVLNNC